MDKKRKQHGRRPLSDVASEMPKEIDDLCERLAAELAK